MNIEPAHDIVGAFLSEVRVGFSAGTSLLSRAIRWADYATALSSRMKPKRVPSEINHVLLHFVFGPPQALEIDRLEKEGLIDGETADLLRKFALPPGKDPDVGSQEFIVEALGGGIEMSPFSHLEDALDDGRVKRLVEVPLPLTLEQRLVVWDRARSMHGVPYDYRALFLYLVWSRFRGKRRSSFHLDNPKRLTCNQFAAAAIAGLLPHLPADPDHPENLRLTPEEFFRVLLGLGSPSFLRGRTRRHIIARDVTLVP